MPWEIVPEAPRLLIENSCFGSPILGKKQSRKQISQWHERGNDPDSVNDFPFLQSQQQ